MSGCKNYTLEITSASIADFLTESNKIGICFRDIQIYDELRVRVSIIQSDFPKLLKLAEKQGISLKILGKKGVYYYAADWFKRPILLFGILLWLFAVLYIPTRVLFVKVEGNKSVDAVKILDAAEKSGIHFGVSRRSIRSEKVKNAFLSQIDALQWIGVNTYGCVAVISVKERHESQKHNSDNHFGSIVAATDGVISSITATKGNVLCSVGQAVRKGQILVSGYTDCGLLIKAEQPIAEIYALTNRTISAFTVSEGTARQSLRRIRKRYSIQIGKNIVKLYNNSGNNDAGCVKIYKQEYLKLPGDFVLPVALITEITSYYDYEDFTMINYDGFTWMQKSADEYLCNIMLAGEILSKSMYGERSGDSYCLKGFYTCNEIIGQLRTERIDS